MEILSEVTSVPIDPAWLIDILVGVAGFFMILQLKDIKTDIKEIKGMLLHHDRDLIKIKTKLEIQEDGL